MTDLGKRLVAAARQAQAIARGEADPATYRVHAPAAGSAQQRMRPVMAGIAIRIFRVDGHGFLINDETDFDLSDFGGVLPAAGDWILYPLVEQGRSRTEPRNREILTGERRVFNPRDMKDRVVLICLGRDAHEGDRDLLPSA